MDHAKVAKFMQLAGHPANCQVVGEKERILGAHLLLSEVLEYVIKGLGVTPVIDGTPILDAENVHYEVRDGAKTSRLDMLDGLADVGYTMYWNALTFGLPLEQAYDLVCDNNLEKFVLLADWSEGERELQKEEWDCAQGVTWPVDVTKVLVVRVKDAYYAVGKDARGKVRKPSTYVPVQLQALVGNG